MVSVFLRSSQPATMVLDRKDGRVVSWTMVVPETYPLDRRLSRMLSHPKMDKRRVEGRFRAILHKQLMRWTKRESLGQWAPSFVWPEGDQTKAAPSAIVELPHFAHGALVFGEHETFRIDLGSGKIIGYESTNLSQPTAPSSRVTEEQVEEKALKRVAKLKSPGKRCCFEFDAAEAGLTGEDALVGLVPAAQVIRRVFVPLKRRQLVETYEVRGARICPTSSMHQLRTQPKENPEGDGRVRFAVPVPGSKGCHGPVHTYYFRTDNGKLLATVAPGKESSFKPLVHSNNGKQPDLPVETLEQMARAAFAGIAENNGLHIRTTLTSIAKSSRKSPTRKLTFQAYFRLAETPFILPPE